MLFVDAAVDDKFVSVIIVCFDVSFSLIMKCTCLGIIIIIVIQSE